MYKINENEFIEIIKELKGKALYITLEAELEGKIALYKMDYKIKDNIVKLTDKKSENYIHIDLNRAYKTMVNKEKGRLQANIDTMNSDIVMIIETMQSNIVDIVRQIVMN